MRTYGVPEGAEDWPRLLIVDKLLKENLDILDMKDLQIEPTER